MRKLTLRISCPHSSDAPESVTAATDNANSTTKIIVGLVDNATGILARTSNTKLYRVTSACYQVDTAGVDVELQSDVAAVNGSYE